MPELFIIFSNLSNILCGNRLIFNNKNALNNLKSSEAEAEHVLTKDKKTKLVDSDILSEQQGLIHTESKRDIAQEKTNKERDRLEADKIKKMLSIEPKNENGPNLSNVLSKKLVGVEINTVEVPKGLEGNDVFRISVKDKKNWMSEGNKEVLAKYFGRDIWNIFEDRDKPEPFEADNPEFMKEFKNNYIENGDMASADSIYVVSKGNEIQGFYLIKHMDLKGGTRAAYVLLTHVNPSLRGKNGLNKKLYEIGFKNENADAFIGLSHTPAAVKDRLNIGKENGFNGYFAGYKDGNSKLKMTDAEKRDLDLLRGAIAKQTEEYEFGDLQKGLPSDFVSYGSQSIPRRKMEEVGFPPNDPLQKTFRNLIRWQEKNRPGESIYGTLINIRNRRFS